MEVDVPEDILAAASEAIVNLMPAKSKDKYEKSYNEFSKWRIEKGAHGASENVLLAYFFEKAKSLKSSTLWSTYSMLKCTLNIKENVDISKHSKMLAFLKRQNNGYQAKKSKILTMVNVIIFLTQAPDESFLMMKVVLIFGLNGACRREELRNLSVNDIEDTGSTLVITLRDTKTMKKRVFTVTSEVPVGINGIDLYRKYLNLRPKHTNHPRFFIYYNKGKCSVQPVGINSFAAIPRKIAGYLQLSDSKNYTGHCLRRTSATFLADSGADIQMLKRHGGWRSTHVAEGYVEDSISNKIKTSRRIFGQNVVPLQSSMLSLAPASSADSLAIRSNLQSNGITFSNLSNCTINVYHTADN